MLILNSLIGCCFPNPFHQEALAAMYSLHKYIWCDIRAIKTSNWVRWNKSFDMQRLICSNFSETGSCEEQPQGKTERRPDSFSMHSHHSVVCCLLFIDKYYLREAKCLSWSSWELVFMLEIWYHCSFFLFFIFDISFHTYIQKNGFVICACLWWLKWHKVV